MSEHRRANRERESPTRVAPLAGGRKTFSSRILAAAAQILLKRGKNDLDHNQAAGGDFF
jgi:hypothetical protein